MEGPNDPERGSPDGAPPGAPAPPPPELEAPHTAAPPQGPPEGGGLVGDAAALLRNRFILFGLGVLVVLLLLTIVLVVVGGGDDDNPPSVVVPTTPGATDATQARPLVGLPGTLLSSATVRNGPGLTYSTLGLIPEGALVPVIGRNEDSTWLQVLYPPNSQLRGWVIASQIDVDGDIQTLVLAGPGAGPQVPLPTSFPFLTPEFPIEGTPTPFEEATATEERETRTPVPSATRIFVETSTAVPPEPTAAGQ
jgi:uncharacterized protein YraI